MPDATSKTPETALAPDLPFGMEPMMRTACRMMAAQAATQAHMIESFRAMQDEMHDFVNHRLDEDRSSGRLLAGCFMPAEVASIWGQFVSTAVSDYAREMNRMSDLVTRAVDGVAKDVSRQASIIAESTGRRS